jgi:predicted nucleic acid-binding protein
LNYALATRAMAIALDLIHPVYDCFYTALAEIEQNAMVIADQRLLTRAYSYCMESAPVIRE